MSNSKVSEISGEPPLGDLISLREAALDSGLSHEHLRRLAGQGRIWAKKIGRNWLTTRHAVEAYLQEGRKPGRPKNP